MPVRIYDIAKKLGIENKEVLSKAKELGIAAARVPSSSLDKITAEYLGSRTPRLIFIHRGPEVIRVNPHRLLRGLDDLPIEPGDLIEIRR